jgi:group I intron endonuclease
MNTQIQSDINSESSESKLQNNDLVLEEIYDTIDKVKGQIYKITCTTTNKIYIGQTYSHIKNHGKYRPAGYLKRLAGHISEAITNTKKKQCTYLNNAIRKYGKNNFTCELIKLCELDKLDHYEQKYIKKYNSLFPNGYNLTTGGKGAMYVAKVDNNMEETNNEPYKHSDETKAKIRYRLKALLASDEKKKERSDKTRIQHMNQRLNKYKNIKLDDDLTKYIFPIIKKGTNIVYKYEIRINGIVSSFYDGKTETNILYQNALNFMNVLKNQNNTINV